MRADDAAVADAAHGARPASARPPIHPSSPPSRAPCPPHRTCRVWTHARSWVLLVLVQMGAADVEAFLKNLVEKGTPVVKGGGLGKGSLSSGTQKVLGAPEGVDQANFDGQRQFDASAFGM